MIDVVYDIRWAIMLIALLVGISSRTFVNKRDNRRQVRLGQYSGAVVQRELDQLLKPTRSRAVLVLGFILGYTLLLVAIAWHYGSPLNVFIFGYVGLVLFGSVASLMWSFGTMFLGLAVLFRRVFSRSGRY